MMNAQVDAYLDNANSWQEEMKLLRKITLNCGLIEEYKWKIPCYTHNSKNIVLITSFKSYCELGFFKGALLSDKDLLLIQHDENSQSSRGLKFTSANDIMVKESVIRAYIFEAIEIEINGLKVPLKATSDFTVPEEFELLLNKNKILQTAFKTLTPGRQRAYLLYFAAPKQSKTKTARIEKYIPRILTGKGLNDCTCGLSKKMPSCDGSHKNLQATSIEK